jgi:flagellar hook-basal body complex protein FliE
MIAPLAVGALSSVLGPAKTASSAASSSGPMSSVTGAADSFTSMMTSFAQDTSDKLKTAESASISGIQGKATTQSVVEAVMNAQEQLQTALAVRDKAVSAFQDITRMPI